MDLNHLVKTLEAERLRKLDYLIDSRDLTALPDFEGHHTLEFRDASKFEGMSETSRFHFMRGAHRQLAQKIEIPEKYYERLLLHPGAWAFNVNWWLEKSPKRYFVRTFQDEGSPAGIIRAFLSERYRVIDHLDILMTALEELRSFQGVKVE